MASSEERMMILRMVEEGKLTPEEGTRLLSAMGERQSEPEMAGATAESASGERATGAAYSASSAYSSAGFATNFGDGSLNGRLLHVRVTNSVTGKHKVDVNIPLGLVEFGLRFIPANAKVNAQTIRDAITSGTRGRIVDVQDSEKGDHVEVFIE